MNEVLYEFEQDKKYIEEYPLESTTGTKKMMQTYHINAVNSRNAYINNKIEKFKALKEDVYKKLKERINTLTPQDTTNAYININNKITIYKNMVNYNNIYNTIYEKLNFNRIITEIGENDNLSEVNALIKEIINIFNQASITLNYNEFNYTMYTESYMKVYFENINNDNFDDNIKKIFDELYWECPNLITHLKLSIRYLYNKYKKQLDLYFQNLKNNIIVQNNINQMNFIEEYSNLLKQLELYQKQDTYILSYPFLNSKTSIYDYLDDTPMVRKHYNKFIFDKDFSTLSDKEKEDFCIEINNLKYIIEELNGYNLYKDLIKDIIERYKKKDTYKGLYQNKLKEIEKEEKEREELLKKYNKNSKGFLFFKKTVNKELLKVQINDHIKKLDILYQELDDMNINDIIAKSISDTSTIRDALTITSSFYDYFKKIFLSNSDYQDLDLEIQFQGLIDYLNDPDDTFIKKIKLMDESNVTDLIYEKYRLLELNVNKDDLTDNLKQLEEAVDFINLRNNINKSKISIHDIELINDFRKIDKN